MSEPPNVEQSLKSVLNIERNFSFIQPAVLRVFLNQINWGKAFTVDNKTGFPIEHDLFHKNVDKNLMLSLKVKHVINQLKKNSEQYVAKLEKLFIFFVNKFN